jgi:hypothetical protein
MSQLKNHGVRNQKYSSGGSDERPMQPPAGQHQQGHAKRRENHATPAASQFHKFKIPVPACGLRDRARGAQKQQRMVEVVPPLDDLSDFRGFIRVRIGGEIQVPAKKNHSGCKENQCPRPWPCFQGEWILHRVRRGRCAACLILPWNETTRPVTKNPTALTASHHSSKKRKTRTRTRGDLGRLFQTIRGLWRWKFKSLSMPPEFLCFASVDTTLRLGRREKGAG